jgi:opacity protein-like surface antigen
MNKLILMLAGALTLAAGAASAQETVIPTTSAHPSPGDVTAQQDALRAGHESGNATWSAFARNVGPASTVTGYANDELGAVGSGNDHVAGAPSAGRADN